MDIGYLKWLYERHENAFWIISICLACSLIASGASIVSAGYPGHLVFIIALILSFFFLLVVVYGLIKLLTIILKSMDKYKEETKDGDKRKNSN